MSLKSLFFILAVTMLWLTAACSRHSESWATLGRADAVMEVHPDSALALLQGIDKSALNGDEEKARYALLVSMARYKNYIFERSDAGVQSTLPCFLLYLYII